MNMLLEEKEHGRSATGDHAREQLLAGLPVVERRLEVAGVSTSVLEAGDGPPVVLLHEQGEFALRWTPILPDLAMTNRVVAPDLPGHGTSEVVEGPLDADHAVAWLGELIERTCTSPPVLVGHMLGGAIAARFAADHADRISRLVLVDAFGLGPFRPAPSFVLALVRYITRPSERSFNRLLGHCLVDPDGVRDQMGARWRPYEAYVLDRARTPSVKAALRKLMKKTGVPAIPSSDLERIAVPTTLIWGRHDPMTRLRIAEAASASYGWPLHVIENAGDDPPMERPEAFLRALRTAV